MKIGLGRAACAAMLLVGLLPVVAVPARAEANAAAREWLDKMVATYSQPYATHFVIEMELEQMGQAMQMRMDGELLRRDERRMRVDLATAMEIPAMGAMSFDTLIVLDGTHMWGEMENPMAGGKQYLKAPIEQFEELQRIQSQTMGVAGGGFNPVEQIESFAELFDLDVAEQDDDRVTLHATMTDETRSRMAEAGGLPPEIQERMQEMKLVLDAKTGFPIEMTIGGETPMMTMRFSETRPLKAVDDGAFAYTPPEGVEVRDLAAAAPAGAPDAREN